MNINDVTKNKCVGCGICESVCPVNAIEITEDSDGFYSPAVNDRACIQCGKCKQTCIKFNRPEAYQINKGKVYAAWSKDDTTMQNSSSGGLGFIISLFAFRNGYDVWGVKYDSETNIPKHILAQSEEDLKLFQGSKYLQSNTEDLCDYLIKNKNCKALIFGTPCQIEMVRLIIEKNHNKNAICVDVFCRGVPTYNLWRNYLKNTLNLGDTPVLDKCIFRDKSYGWHSCQMTISDKNTQYSAPAKDDWYYKLYSSALCFRDSCYSCNRKLESAYSDIRIGDFWGNRYESNQKGVSIVIINSVAGQRLFESVVPYVSIEEANFDEVIVAQKYIYNEWNHHKINEMRSYLNKDTDFEYIYRKLIRPHWIKRIATSVYQSIPRRYQLIIKRVFKR